MENTIKISAPPEKIWEMLALGRFQEWMEGWKSVKYISEVQTPEDKYRVGASAHMVGDGFWMDLSITESLKNEKISGHSTSGSITCTMTYTMKPTAAGTELTSVVSYEMHSTLMKILDKLTESVSKKMAERSFERLKSILEK